LKTAAEGFDTSNLQKAMLEKFNEEIARIYVKNNLSPVNLALDSRILNFPLPSKLLLNF
jgi:hypothetical protein